MARRNRNKTPHQKQSLRFFPKEKHRKNCNSIESTMKRDGSAILRQRREIFTNTGSEKYIPTLPQHIITHHYTKELKPLQKCDQSNMKKALGQAFNMNDKIKREQMKHSRYQSEVQLPMVVRHDYATF